MCTESSKQTTGQKRVLAIHDICGVGKCSLTAALPILSAVGIEACAIPTAVFSTHTAFPSFVYQDLSDFLIPMAEALQKENLHFDAIYTGYLANAAQAEQVMRIVDMLADEDTCLLVDPAMADNGKLYAGLSDSFPQEMGKLCRKAQILTPNLTEALLLLGRDPTRVPKTDREMANIVRALNRKTGAAIVLTSASTREGMTGCAVLESADDEVFFYDQPYVGHGFHGTGDVFSSVLLCARLSRCSVFRSTEIAADFVSRVIARTVKENPDLWYGVNFEAELAALAKTLCK